MGGGDLFLKGEGLVFWHPPLLLFCFDPDFPPAGNIGQTVMVSAGCVWGSVRGRVGLTAETAALSNAVAPIILTEYLGMSRSGQKSSVSGRMTLHISSAQHIVLL